MAVRLVCRACGKRLKLPEGMQSKGSARCPKCLAVVDLTPALEASAYMPTVAIPELAAIPASPPDNIAKTGNSAPKPPADTPSQSPGLIGGDDPLPYLPTGAPPAPDRAHPPLAKSTQTPLPARPENTKTSSAKTDPPKTKKSTKSNAHTEEPLSLDEDHESGETPAEVTPFRVPVRVLADSLRKIMGPCFAVVVPHGVFLEHEPMKPFLYVPVGCSADSPASGELTVILPDRRAVTFRFTGRSARPLARDVRAFLAGERPAPVASDYAWKTWMLGVAFIFALGLAAGPLVLSQTANLGLDFGAKVGAGFTFIGLLANVMVVLFSRWTIPTQMAVMAGICGLVTGIFLFGATAYLAGRQKAEEQANSESPPPPPQPTEPPPAPPAPPPERAPSHLDRAKKNGSSAIEDGSADVTALGLAPDGNSLGIGHADGTTRIWPLDQPTFEAVLPGPKADGPITRLEFDKKSLFIFAHTATGVIAAPRSGPPATPAKIPGTPVAIAPEVVNDQIRFAAVRGNLLQLRLLPSKFVRNPPEKAKGYALPGKGDEINPLGKNRDPNRGPGPTFFAWTPDGRLFVGQPNGTISIWSGLMKAEAPNNDHKAPVKAWASCLANGDFATGDDRGHVALWSHKGGKPTLWAVFGGAPIAGLCFNATGSRLAVTDNTGWLVIWDTAAGKALHRVKRSAAVRAMAYGPNDNVFLLADGKTVEVWWLPELVK